MVNIENITRREEERKSNIKRTKDLLNKFFEGMHINDNPLLISVSENELSDPFLFIGYSKLKLDKIRLYNQEYYEKTLAFAEEYEKNFNIKVNIQIDYSK